MMSDDRHETTDAPQRRRDHLRLVVEEPVVATELVAPPPRPRTIGRLIAQTALIADSAISRRRSEPADSRGMAGKLLGRFR